MCTPDWKNKAKALEAELKVANERIAELEEWKPYPPQSGVDRISPQGWVAYGDVIRKETQVTIKGSKLLYGILADTNSMDRFMDAPHITVSETNFDRSQLKVGDIVIYNDGSRYVVHQITEIKEDNGRVYTLQGTNNAVPDPYIVRDEHIMGVVVAVIYAKGE